MERSGFSGTLFSNVGGGSGMLGLDMPLLSHPRPRPRPQQPTTQNPQHLQVQQHPQMVAISNPQHQHHPSQPFDQQTQTQLPVRQPNDPFTISNQNPTPKTQMTNSDDHDDEANYPHDHDQENSFDAGRKNISPWQRMKWTDTMVRLLIMAVYYIGDEAGSELGGSDKKKPATGGGGGAPSSQKKGKWKSVSRAMMDKGFRVSPQQCEDKFNDLNKRYKRVKDILGKGTACKVVENHSLLDSMDHLSPKMKEEVRKLLNSKHLFFKEMCAYHNSCGHGTSTSQAAAPNPPPTATEAMEGASNQPHQQQHQQLCRHSFTSNPSSPPSSMVHSNSKLDNHDWDDDDDDDDSDEGDGSDDEEDGPEEEGRGRKRARMTTMKCIWPNTTQESALEEQKQKLTGILENGSQSSWEKKQWVMRQLVEAEEKGVKFQHQALEMEKQRMRWLKYSSKKERELQRMKMENQRKTLENERMLLLLRNKQMELLMSPSNSSSFTH